MDKWPKRVTVWISGDKERMWTEGEEIGLTSDALQLFRHALTEVEIELSVNQDGTYKIVSTKG